MYMDSEKEWPLKGGGRFYPEEDPRVEKNYLFLIREEKEILSVNRQELTA